MSFPRLVFPLTVDFGTVDYWIDDAGPFHYGTAATAFFCGDDLADGIGDGLLLMRNLENVLQAFGGHLQPYAQERKVSSEFSLHPEKCRVDYSVCYTFHSTGETTDITVERCTFTCLRDFLYVELWKAIQKGNAPRQCRLCGNWFLHTQSEKTMYCERIAPGESEKTCQEVGARAVFEKKIQSEDTWKIYKRAYKKYYARYMKGNMSKSAFKDWVTQAAGDRNLAIEQLKATADAALNAQIVEQLKEKLNRL